VHITLYAHIYVTHPHNDLRVNLMVIVTLTVTVMMMVMVVVVDVMVYEITKYTLPPRYKERTAFFPPKAPFQTLRAPQPVNFSYTGGESEA
jgi:hypothetical protein